MSQSKKLTIKWNLSNHATYTTERYCSNCGKVVTFKDSGYRRQNANGKNIFHFAIYKCDKGHTWNKKIEIFTAKSNLINEPLDLAFSEIDCSNYEPTIQPVINILEAKDAGYHQIEILVSINGDKQRLDKLLAERIEGCSRSQIVKHIEAGHIKLDRVPAKGKTSLSHEHLIHIELSAM
jgi:hypothetical protein